MDKVERLFAHFRKNTDAELERLAYATYQVGFESATDTLDELSNQAHNSGETEKAEVLRWAAKELRGENEIS
jgi:hypothetical protein